MSMQPQRQRRRSTHDIIENILSAGLVVYRSVARSKRHMLVLGLVLVLGLGLDYGLGFSSDIRLRHDPQLRLSHLARQPPRFALSRPVGVDQMYSTCMPSSTDQTKLYK